MSLISLTFNRGAFGIYGQEIIRRDTKKEVEAKAIGFPRAIPVSYLMYSSIDVIQHYRILAIEEDYKRFGFKCQVYMAGNVIKINNPKGTTIEEIITVQYYTLREEND